MMHPQFTFEFCKELKESGLKQPDKKDGQVWYSHSGTPYLIYDAMKGHGMQNLLTGILYPANAKNVRESTYCPSIDEVHEFIHGVPSAIIAQNPMLAVCTVECEQCKGGGEVEKNICRGEEGMQIEMDVMVVCSECDGTGVVPV